LVRFEFVYSPGFDAPIAGTAAPEPSTWAMIDRVRGAWLCRLAGAAKERGARGLVHRRNEKGGPKAAIFQFSQAKTAAEPPKSQMLSELAGAALYRDKGPSGLANNLAA
jgi:hypothetical protein